MKICLIGEEFKKESGQGVSRLVTELYDNLCKYGCDVERIEVGTFKSPIRRLANNVLKDIAMVFKKTGAELYHYVTPDPPFSCIFKRPSVVTVYDIVPLVLKNERKMIFNIYFWIMMQFAKHANHIIAISKSTKEDLIKILKIPDEKISVVYPGVDHKKFYPENNRMKNSKFIVGFLGGLVKRKNATILLDAAKLLEKENVLFKIAGKGKGLNELIEKKERLNLKNVEFIGFVPEEEMNTFYNSIDLLIVPTLYDGFSLPCMEAITSGCPVITSNTSALPEVAGEAGLLVNPTSPEEIAEGIKKIAQNHDLRMQMIKKGLQHSQKFSWETNAKETIEVYKKVLAPKKK